MSEDLELTVGQRYSIITLAFFPTYVVFELPSTVVIRWIGPRIHLSTITLTWGIILFGMAFCGNWQTLAGLRAILGFLEAGFFPGCVYFLRYVLQNSRTSGETLTRV
jgi:MFS family permease